MQMQRKKCKNYATICIHVSSAHTCRRHYQTLQWNKYMQLTHEGCLEAFSMACTLFRVPLLSFLHSLLFVLLMCALRVVENCVHVRKKDGEIHLKLVSEKSSHGCVREIKYGEF